MGFLSWLLGKKEAAVASAPEPGPAVATAPERPAPAPVAATPPAAPAPKASSEADNLRRWRESGQARAWVEVHRGQWGHGEWLALLDELKRSPYWPLPPDGVGQVLEDVKREWLRRN